MNTREAGWLQNLKEQASFGYFYSYLEHLKISGHNTTIKGLK